MEKLIIDRVERNIVVCEKDDGDMVNIDISIIEGNVKEGKVLTKTLNGFKVDEESTKSREEYINGLMEGMWEDE
ncbi:DUF3006 domain-containing protein [Clostridium hydrogeniformans]|uniref:DUF3006 domain-containing protein n=1 Tax=Clostridium hydrogeniformans TaxID=349933 RepID=UPI000482BA21|nr:DUF3006 domain-containing protein [Clostridium hydrogeniformans]